MDRRRFLVAISGGLLATPAASMGQHAGKPPRVGLLFPLSRQVASVSADALESAFRELGYVLGESIILEYRWAEGRADRLPALAAELVSSKVDVIVSVATQATLAAKAATTTLPIVTVGAADPVGTGLVQSLARPGGNVTGIGVHLEEFTAKLPELLKEAVPHVSHVAYLEDPSNPGHASLLVVTRDTAKRMGLRLTVYEVRTLEELQPTFASMTRDRVGGLVVAYQVFTYQHRRRIATLAATHRLPAVYGGRAFVDAGGLMSYGVSEAAVFRRAATYVNRILNGSRPADLPVEQPDKFEVVLNLRAGSAIGLTMPSSLVLRADEIIR
jgi:putative ABC transport system substrate-binding protein